MTRTTPDPRAPKHEAHRTGLAESGARRLARAVETIRDAYLGVAAQAGQPLADELTRVVELLRDPPEGVDPSQLVLEADRLLGAIEEDLARSRRSA